MNQPLQHFPASPPSATGPAGSVLEGNVGGYYLLALLAMGEPRGLPGATIQGVSFQRVREYPLDDIVVHAMNANGSQATLEIQCKRSMTFTASDAEFSDVVARVWHASKKSEFEATRYELVAIGKTTTRIERDCQEVLRWARALADSDTFASHIAREGFASDGMRSFVAAFQKNLKDAGGVDDNETVWRLLRRFQILVFDFESPGSPYHHFARERCGSVLNTPDADRKMGLWTVLCGAAMQSATSAGGFDHASLIDHVTKEHGYSFVVRPDLRAMYVRLSEDTRNALADIEATIAGVALSRTTVVEQAQTASEAKRILAIVGAPGTGKSAILKHLAELQGFEGTTIVLSRGRIVAGGWTSWAQTMTCPVAQGELLNELACGGGATLFIDNIDQIDDAGQLATVNDLIRGALANPEWRIVFTAANISPDWLAHFPGASKEAIATVTTTDLTDIEAAEIAAAKPMLAPILSSSHPARGLARNPFHLSRLIALDNSGTGALSGIATEVDLAQIWWRFGGGRSETNRFPRLKLLRFIGKQIIAMPSYTATRTDELEGATVVELLQADSLLEHQAGYSVAFRHDVLRDWTIGFLLHESPEQFDKVDLTAPIPPSLSRGVEFAARQVLASDATGAQWRSLLAKVSAAQSHGSWRRQMLLALSRSEDAPVQLERQKGALLAEDGKLLAELVKVTMSVDAVTLGSLLVNVTLPMEIPRGAESLMIPRGTGWAWLILWLVANAKELPVRLIPDLARLFQGWLCATQSHSIALNARVVELLYNWLVRSDEALKPGTIRDFSEIKEPGFIFPNMRAVRDDIRLTFCNFCHLTPELAKRYLVELDADAFRFGELESIIRYPGALVKAAPEAFADFVLKVLPDNDDARSSGHSSDLMGPFAHHEYQFTPVSPGQGPFLELLLSAPAPGLRLVHGIVAHTARWWKARQGSGSNAPPALTLSLPEGDRVFEGGARAYGWSRSEMPSGLTASSLMALEAWGHLEIEAGRPFADVMKDVLGSSGTSAALVEVVVDLALSHWGAAYSAALPLLASPEVLRYDGWRNLEDISGTHSFRPMLQPENAAWKVKRGDLAARPSRRLQLWDRIGEIALGNDHEAIRLLQSGLNKSNVRIAASPGDDTDFIDGLKACARRAVAMSDRRNWSLVDVSQADGSVAQQWQFAADPRELEQRQAKLRSAMAGSESITTRLSIQQALLNVGKSTPETVATAIEWAKAKETEPKKADADDFDVEWDGRAVVMAAALALRDYHGDDPEILTWALVCVESAVAQETERYRGNSQIQYSGQAIGALGLVSQYARTRNATSRERLLHVAPTHNEAVIRAIGSQLPMLSKTSPELVRSLIRLGLAGSVYPWAQDTKVKQERVSTLHASIRSAITSEANWLANSGNEPTWPDLPNWVTRRRRGIRIGGGHVEEPDDEPPSYIASEQVLGAWISELVPLTVAGASDWLLDLAKTLLDWTATANGPHGEDERERDHRPYTWNASFFDFLGVMSVAMPAAQAVSGFINEITKFNDEPFCDCAAAFLRGLDRATVASDTLNSDDPGKLRRVIAEHMKNMRMFRRLADRKEFTAERHLADLISAMFFHPNSLALSRLPSLPCKLRDETEAARALTTLVVAAPRSGYLATAFLNVLEQQADPVLLHDVVQALAAWTLAYGSDSTFWVDREIGIRACSWLLKVLALPEAAAHLSANRQTLLGSLDTMIQAGVGPAQQIEQALSAHVQPERPNA